ncbi:hypothetical protein [Salinivibrio sp. IB872]|uniref:hypothetical protein n=1 Tax=Salinivibrio sp. IB872 TaxID=1766123 RepID=UPI000984A32D|nr:hypothetical protein [Salinivibrio sp. IB872]OOF29592.1 hypothetical protein BZJ18_00900 [Salinivibrio sp. IB872]
MYTQRFWFVLVCVFTLLGVVAAYGWFAETVKFGGFIATGSLLLAMGCFRFAIKNKDPDVIFGAWGGVENAPNITEEWVGEKILQDSIEIDPDWVGSLAWLGNPDRLE